MARRGILIDHALIDNTENTKGANEENGKRRGGG
jgi:hypothetical protein